jgi:DNA-binding NtrC family response regulator
MAYDFLVEPERKALPSPGTILLVEDEDFVREAAFQILQDAGYRVLKARNATEAMRMFHQYNRKIELLITDIVIPGRNGGELAHDLKAMHQGMKIIFMSG